MVGVVRVPHGRGAHFLAIDDAAYDRNAGQLEPLVMLLHRLSEIGDAVPILFRRKVLIPEDQGDMLQERIIDLIW